MYTFNLNFMIMEKAFNIDRENLAGFVQEFKV